MNNRVKFGQRGTCFIAECADVTAETYNEIKEFCKLKVFSGFSAGSGIIINARNEIRYLTLGGIAGNDFPLESNKQCSYMLEF